MTDNKNDRNQTQRLQQAPVPRLIPADAELKKFIETGGRPDAKSSFDELLKKAAKPKR